MVHCCMLKLICRTYSTRHDLSYFLATLVALGMAMSVLLKIVEQIYLAPSSGQNFNLSSTLVCNQIFAKIMTFTLASLFGNKQMLADVSKVNVIPEKHLPISIVIVNMLPCQCQHLAPNTFSLTELLVRMWTINFLLSRG